MDRFVISVTAVQEGESSRLWWPRYFSYLSCHRL